MYIVDVIIPTNLVCVLFGPAIPFNFINCFLLVNIYLLSIIPYNSNSMISNISLVKAHAL